MAPPIPPEAAKEIEFVKSLVAKHFPVYDVRVNYDVVEFFCRVDNATLEDNFERMREDMAQHGYIPMITYDKGEHIVTVAKKPTLRYRSIYVNVIMLVITFLTMLVAGALQWAGYAGNEGTSLGSIFASQENVVMGLLTFALPLMAILAVHELAHFMMARRRRIAASLPFFIPSIPPLGTFGAFISLRDPIPNRKALLEIGVAGPIAGMLLALPIGILGLVLTNSEARPVPTNIGSEGVMGVSFPVLYLFLEMLFPIKGDYLLHPTAFAAWVGFLVTALNLLPVGQLDGGHVARALLGARAKYLSWVTVAILVGIGMYYFGWLLFALLILFLGARHPPPLNDISPLDLKRKGVGVLAFALLVVAFVPIPMVPIAADYSFDVVPLEETNVTIPQGASWSFSLKVDNVGNTLNEIEFTKQSSPVDWETMFKLGSHDDSTYAEALTLKLNAGENTTVDVLVISSISAVAGQNYTVVVKASSVNSSFARTQEFNFVIENPQLTFTTFVAQPTITAGNWTYASVQVNNTGPNNTTITLNASLNQAQFVDVFLTYSAFNSSGPVNLTVPGNGSEMFGVQIYVGSPATPGAKTIPIEVYYSNALQTTIYITITVA